MPDHLGFYDRGKLPHRDIAGSIQAVTFRLADSIPKRIIEKWRTELAAALDAEQDEIRAEAHAELRRRTARYEDLGQGTCVLRNRELAAIVQETLMASHSGDCRLFAWCVMPNHVHVVFRLAAIPLGRLVGRWKGSTAHAINQALGRTGPLWQREYFDRAIRDEQHFWRAVRYIHGNPVKAGLCTTPEAWPFSSAGIGWEP
jgi:putative DNA methylase